MSVNIFKLVPNPPIISGMASVTFDWKHIRHFEEIGKVFTEGFAAICDPELPF